MNKSKLLKDLTEVYDNMSDDIDEPREALGYVISELKLLNIHGVMRSCFDAGVEYQRQFESKLSESYDKPNFEEWYQNNYA